jgi:hypothetical protein
MTSDQEISPQNKQPDYSLIDQKLLPMAAVISALSEVEGVIDDEGWGMKMSIDEIEIDMPMEFDIMTDDEGNLVLGGAPPTQTIETSFTPVFHKVKVGIKVFSEEDHGK